jgi:hypothetical protein
MKIISIPEPRKKPGSIKENETICDNDSNK